MDDPYEQIIQKDKKEELEKFQIREILQVVLLIAFFIATIIFLSKHFNFKVVQDYIQNTGIIAPIIYIIIKAGTIVIAPIIGGPFYIIAGSLFGFWKGFAYSMIGDIIGSSIAFFLSRIYGRKVIRLFFSKRMMGVMEKMLTKIETWKGFLFARIVLFTLHDLLSYAAGLTKIRFITYISITTLTFIIPVALTVALGLAILNRSILVWIIAAAILIVVIGIIYEVLRSRRIRKK